MMLYYDRNTFKCRVCGCWSCAVWEARPLSEDELKVCVKEKAVVDVYVLRYGFPPRFSPAIALLHFCLSGDEKHSKF